MKFTRKDGDPHLFYRMVSEENGIEIGVHPVIFGFRIRAGYIGDIAYEIDYCAGNDVKDIERIYSMVLTFLSSKAATDRSPFEAFPIQKVKPMHNDPTCFMKLMELVSSLDIIDIKLPQVHAMKRHFLEEMMK